MAQGRGGSLHLSRTALSSAPLFPFTGAFRDSIPAGWLRLGGEENSPSRFMRLRLVRSHRSSSVCELAIQSRGGGVSTNAPNMSSQPNSIDDRVVLVTDAHGNLTKPTSGGRLVASQNAR